MTEPERRWTELPAPPTNGSNGDEQHYFEPTRDYEPIQPQSGLRAMLQKIWAPIAAAVGLLVKFGAVIFKLKIFTVAGSMLVSVGAYALARRLVVRRRPRAADLRARDGTRARAAPSGSSRFGAALHPVHGRGRRHEADARERVEGGAGRARRPGARRRSARRSSGALGARVRLETSSRRWRSSAS